MQSLTSPSEHGTGAAVRIRTVGRTPNGIWGGKLMWNQTPLLLSRAKDLPERSGSGLLRAQDEGWRNWFAEEDVHPMDVPYPVLWRNLTQVVAQILEALGQDPRLAPTPVLERQADQRSDEWVDRYRADEERESLPT